MLRWLTAGESHGEALTAVLEGLPAGVEVTTEHLQRALARLPAPPALLLVDGVLPLRGWSGEQCTLVGGDLRCAAIAAFGETRS